MSDKSHVIALPCNERFVIEELTNWARKACKLSLEITGPEDRDGVVFYFISSDELNIQNSYDIGYYYSGLITRLRRENIINW